MFPENDLHGNKTWKHEKDNNLNAEFNINNMQINKCNKVKYLGLIISSNFKSLNHIKYVTDKVNSAKAQLKTAFDSKYSSKHYQ